MKYGILGPYMTGTDRPRLLEWLRRVDEGPFATIATGERILWPQIEQHAFLAAAAAVTERVRVMSHITIVPMHPPVVLAKRLASIDVISGGRLIVGVGTGVRTDDYQASGATYSNRWSRLDASVAVIRRVWAGEPPWDGAEVQVGPRPVQPGGPPIYTSASGESSLARDPSGVPIPGWLPSEAAAALLSWRLGGKPHLAGLARPPRCAPPGAFMPRLRLEAVRRIASWSHPGQDNE
jgi:hypothetical protein